jgi:serine/threonine protein kinase
LFLIFIAEYAYTTKVNEKIDVYSFGVVLLELATGREPNSGDDEDTSLAEWAWRQFGQGKPVSNCLDQEIKEPCFLQEMTAVFNLGLVCTHSLPSNRPSMKDVLEILRRCSPDNNGEKRTVSEFDIVPLLGNVTCLSSNRRSNRLSDDNDDSLVYSV